MAIKLIDTIEPKTSKYPSVRAVNVWFDDDTKLQDKVFGTTDVVDITDFISEGKITSAGLTEIKNDIGKKTFLYIVDGEYYAFSTSINNNGGIYRIQFLVLKDDNVSYNYNLFINESSLAVSNEEYSIVSSATDPLSIEGNTISIAMASNTDVENLL